MSSATFSETLANSRSLSAMRTTPRFMCATAKVGSFLVASSKSCVALRRLSSLCSSVSQGERALTSPNVTMNWGFALRLIALSTSGFALSISRYIRCTTACACNVSGWSGSLSSIRSMTISASSRLPPLIASDICNTSCFSILGSIPRLSASSSSGSIVS